MYNNREHFFKAAKSCFAAANMTMLQPNFEDVGFNLPDFRTVHKPLDNLNENKGRFREARSVARAFFWQ